MVGNCDCAESISSTPANLEDGLVEAWTRFFCSLLCASMELEISCTASEINSDIAFGIPNTINHFEETLSKVTVEKWKKKKPLCEHVRNEEDFYWERDGMTDEAIDNVVINLEESHSDSDLF
ncbi:hypothetical protein C0J52_18911 [Blattella germanica]|nr:hypothetical protein C0J52_18911 [Blattella germanica]